MRRMPPLNALRAFEAAARHMSFTEAAREMCITPAAVSQQVKRLELELGVSLFQRLPRGLVLSDAGARYGRQLTDAFQEIHAATREVAPEPESESLTLSTMPSFAARWLIPRLTSFSAAYPHITVRVQAETSVDALERSSADLKIRYGDERLPGAICELPFPRTVFPVCHPRVACGDHPIRVPADIGRHVLLQLDDQRFPSGYEDSSWLRWVPLVGERAIVQRRGPSFSFVHLMLQAAAAGQGIAIASLALAGDDLAAGRLIRPLPHEMPVGRGYWLVRPTHGPESPRASLFREWLYDEAERFVATMASAAPS